MKISAKNIRTDLQRLANPEKAKILARFFKTGKGEYGEGDIFLGITVPGQRTIAGKYSDLSLKDIQKLLLSRIHEHRLVALLILITQYKRAGETEKREIYNFYLKNTRYINNWDLVDLSAQYIIGAYLMKQNRSVLYDLVQSDNLWERRIAIMSTFAFIKEHQYNDTLRITKMLLRDKHDLIHKAVGWMLREVGKRDQEAEEAFLKKFHCDMPRTMLRYAIERFDEEKKGYYLKKSKQTKNGAEAGSPAHLL